MYLRLRDLREDADLNQTQVANFLGKMCIRDRGCPVKALWIAALPGSSPPPPLFPPHIVPMRPYSASIQRSTLVFPVFLRNIQGKTLDSSPEI